MSQSYEFTTDYEWMLDQFENILWIMQKTSPLLNKTQFDNRAVEAVFNDIKKNILMQKDGCTH
jgi:CMP-N-acetylneuraminic acid synthetase